MNTDETTTASQDEIPTAEACRAGRGQFRICDNCGNPHEDDGDVCTTCGATLPAV